MRKEKGEGREKCVSVCKEDMERDERKFVILSKYTYNKSIYVEANIHCNLVEKLCKGTWDHMIKLCNMVFEQ